MQVKYENHYLDDLAVVNFARASLDKKHEMFTEGDASLLRYLAKHEHWTPFAHPQITLHFIVPIFVDRQLVRHTVGFVRSECSRRYIDNKPTFYSTDKLGARAENKKQGAKEGEYVTEIIHPIFKYTIKEYLESIYEESLFAYNDLLDQGVAPEDARMVLPLATDTSYYLTGSLAAYFRMYNLRIQKDAQRQSQQIAQMINDIVEPLFPYSWLALKEANNARD